MAFSTTQKLFHALFTPNLRDRENTLSSQLSKEEAWGSTHGAQGIARQFPDVSMLLQRAGLYLYCNLLHCLLVDVTTHLGFHPSSYLVTSPPDLSFHH